MRSLLTFSRLIDTLNERIGKTTAWLVLIAVLLSAGNAVARKLFDTSSNAFLELQWYMFAAIFLLGGGYTLLKQEHVRIDLIYGRFSRRTQIAIDLFGTVFFLLPFALLLLWLSWPYFLGAWQSGESSPNPGGLILWPVKLLIPTGFLLLLLQGSSEFIKRIAFLAGQAPDPALAHEKSGELDPIAALQTTTMRSTP
jgi:TRAP-type mannitol/chloroaromatic compound transport system permease small subunit